MPVGRRRDRVRPLHRVHRAAVRLLPAVRVRRDRGDVAAVHRAVPRRLAGPVSDVLGPLWTLLKAAAVAVVIIWLRVAWPRLREDQLQRLAWLYLVPLALASWPSPESGWCSPHDRALLPAHHGPVPDPEACCPGSSGPGHHRAHPGQPQPHRGVPRRPSRTCRRAPRASSRCWRRTAPAACCAPASAPTGASTSTRTRRRSPATTEGGRERQRNVLDRFAIDFSLCMYCGHLHRGLPVRRAALEPEFEYAELDIRDLLHEKDRPRASGWPRCPSRRRSTPGRPTPPRSPPPASPARPYTRPAARAPATAARHREAATAGPARGPHRAHPAEPRPATGTVPPAAPPRHRPRTAPRLHRQRDRR
jgi:hypothetical protein